MKIIHTITSLERGGAQAVLELLVEALKDQGHEQAIIYFHEGPYRQRFIDRGIPVYQVRGIASSFDPIAWYRLYKRIRSVQPDLIHSLLWATNFMVRSIARILKIPVILTLHNNSDQNGMIRNFLDRLVSFKGHEIVAVSSHVRDSFYQYQRSDIPLTIIENGIDTDCAYDRGYDRAQIGLAQEHIVIGAVGRLVPLKRYTLLIDAFEKVQHTILPLRLVIIGTGPQEKFLRAYAHDKGLDDLIVWIIDQPALPYYPLFDLFAQTSAKEGISMALLEAMSFGIPPLITHHGGIHPVVTDGKTGFVARFENATDLGGIMAKAVGDDLLRKRVGGAAQQEVRSRFSKKQMIAAYSALFERKLCN